jgi:hypothetical protein
VLDTSVQIDRQKSGPRGKVIEGLLAEFGWHFTTSIALLEFKAVLIQECITIHNRLRRTGARFTEARDELLESQHRQHKLRAHLFNNLIQVYGSSFDITPDSDARLAEQARLRLENIIPKLYAWFRQKSAHQVLCDRVNCTRAAEPPTKKVARFDTNLPKCKRGVNKSCSVETALRNEGPGLQSGLELHATPVGDPNPNQFRKTLTVIERVTSDPAADLSHGDCRNAGDVLIGLEAKDKVTHALSTNAREWEVISSLLGFEFIHVTYPTERS